MGVIYLAKIETDLNMVQTDTNEKLQRSLSSRHLTMIAIGGAIGTGLFVASGASVSSAGSGGALVAYLVIGIMVYFIMTSLGEMATFMPISGSFSTYATKFVDPALGFAFGWNYWFSWATAIPAEFVAGSIIMKYWFPNSPDILWSALFLALLFGLNFLSARGYGEAEYWFAGVKVLTIICFLIIGVAMIFGIMFTPAIGIQNFTPGGTPFHGGIMAIIGVALIAGFSFQGTELVGIAAGESDSPRQNIPRAINSVFWRILIFYVLAILVIGLIIPYTDPNLLKSDVSDITVSPFTMVFKKAGLAFAAALMNAVILTSVLSAGNSAMYASTRMLWALAKENKAPKIFARVNSRGVPANALYVTTAFGFLAFLSSLFGNGIVYVWLLNCTGMAGFITWLGIAISHYRFRKAYVAQGRNVEDLLYRAKWYPFGPLFAFAICLLVILLQNYSAFTGGHIDWIGVFSTYIGIPIFLALWLGYKFIKKTRVIPLQECVFDSSEDKI
jgi:lysine-specific permease